MRSSSAVCWVVLLLTLGREVAAEARICLNMIAKNEAAEVLQCLEPLAPELSGWTLCDTGSTDRTVEVVQAFFDKEDIPGSVAHHTWQDFGHNRNLCIQEGVEFSLVEAKKRGMPAGSHFCDYLLFLDADQILQRTPDLKPGDIKAMQLHKDGYHMKERGNGIEYSNLRLVSTGKEWEWVGEVHEYVHRKDGAYTPQYHIPGVWFDHDASGGQGGKRFVRDGAILSKAVQQRPKDPRARFYLANTLKALERYEEAITHYLERIRLGGWDEECFMSALSIADMTKIAFQEGKLISKQVRDAVSNFKSAHKQLSAEAEEQEELQFQAALANLTQAIHDAAETRSTATENGKGSKQDPQEDRKVELAQKAVDAIKQARRQRQFDVVVAAYMATAAILPYRPEPWTHLARMYREQGDNARCYHFAAAGLAQGPPRADALFINTNVLKELLDEMCVCGYYVEHAVDQGHMACRKLEQALVTDLQASPDSQYLRNWRKRVNENMVWYAEKTGTSAAAQQCPTADHKGQCAREQQ